MGSDQSQHLKITFWHFYAIAPLLPVGWRLPYRNNYYDNNRCSHRAVALRSRRPLSGESLNNSDVWTDGPYFLLFDFA